MALKQEVMMKVYDQPDGGSLVLDATGLRTDFDIRLIPEFSRATFTIYNLTDSTIASLTSGDKYVTLQVRLHGGKIRTLADRYYVSNAVDELILPNRVTKLFCFDKLRKSVLEKRVATTVVNPTLRNLVQRTIQSTGYIGETTFASFPFGLLDEPMQKTRRPLNGSAQQCLRLLEKEFDFKTYTVNGGFTFMHNPDLGNVKYTDLATKPANLVLNTRSMRSNPKIGIASASIDSNLDPNIQPGSVLDLSNLITVAVDATEGTLQLVDGYLKSFSEFSKYQALAVQHKGSNYTKDWNTVVTAYSPSKGKLMPTVQWAGKTH